MWYFSMANEFEHQSMMSPMIFSRYSLDFKGSSDQNHFIFEINVGKSRIRHRTNSNDAILNPFLVDLEFEFWIRSISDPPLSDIDV